MIHTAIALPLLLFLMMAAGGTLLRQAAKPLFTDPITLLIGPALGLSCVTAAAALAWCAGLPPESSLPLIAAIVVVTFGATIWMKPSSRAAATQPTLFKPPWWDVLASVLLVLIYVFPLLFTAAWMGSGDAPPVFFNVDTPYYLGHVHALMQSDVYPPTSLSVLGVTKPYHYGVQLSAALFARVGGLPAHTALFWVVTPIFLIGKLAVVWRIATLGARRGMPLWLGLACLLFLVPYPVLGLYQKFAGPFLTQPLDVIGNLPGFLIEVQQLDTGYPILSDVAGSFLTYLVLLFMIDESLRYRFAGIALAVGSLPLFKSPFLVPVGIVVGLWVLYQLVAARRFVPFLAAAAACLIAFRVAHFTVPPSFTFSVNLNPATHSAVWQDLVSRAFAAGAFLVMVALAGLLTVTFTGRGTAGRYATAWVLLSAALLILWLPVFVLVSYVDTSGILREVPEARQWITPVKYIAPVALALEMNGIREWGGRFVWAIPKMNVV